MYYWYEIISPILRGMWNGVFIGLRYGAAFLILWMVTINYVSSTTR